MGREINESAGRWKELFSQFFEKTFYWENLPVHITQKSENFITS